MCVGIYFSILLINDSCNDDDQNEKLIILTIMSSFVVHVKSPKHKCLEISTIVVPKFWTVKNCLFNFFIKIFIAMKGGKLLGIQKPIIIILYLTNFQNHFWKIVKLYFCTQTQWLLFFFSANNDNCYNCWALHLRFPSCSFSYS